MPLAPGADGVTMSVPVTDPGRAAADLSRFLSACWCEPTPVFAQERLFDSMHEAAACLDGPWADRVRSLGEAFAAQDLTDLLVDYTRLLLGPVEAPARPYGSVWRGGDPALMDDSSLAVLDLYRQGGLDLDEQAHEAPDHIAVELEFLYVLGFRAAQAREEGRAGDLAAIERLRERFLAEHLGAWIGRFAAAVRESAGTAFYRQLAELTDVWVRRQLPAGTH